MTTNQPCLSCKSEGFEPSHWLKDSCTFCDGTEGGQPVPTVVEAAELVANRLYKFSEFTMDYQNQMRPLLDKLVDPNAPALTVIHRNFTYKNGELYED